MPLALPYFTIYVAVSKYDSTSGAICSVLHDEVDVLAAQTALLHSLIGMASSLVGRAHINPGDAVAV